MSNHKTEISKSAAEIDHSQSIRTFPVRSALLGKGTVIKRALPSLHKRMIGAWCFLDHAGPVTFPAGQGMDVGPHPHIGLQTFTWMIDGTVMHSDSLGSKQLIRPQQVNLMTAGFGISHTEVSPVTETQLHAAQLWIALPDDQRNMPAKFEHYPELPVVEHDQVTCTILVGEFLSTRSPVEVYSPLLAVDLNAQADTKICLPLNPSFEYGLLALEGTAQVEGHELNLDNLLVVDTGLTQLELELKAGQRVLLIGGEPFATPILLWWNFVARNRAELEQAREQWIQHDHRFGEIPDYVGDRLEAPVLPDQMRASK